MFGVFLLIIILKLKKMGSKVRAICKCGVDKDILIGGGMSTFKFQCYFPCLCLDCKDVVQVNIKGIFKATCPDCYSENVIPYNDDRLSRIKGDREIMRYYIGHHLILTNGTYYCGRCDKSELRFQRLSMNWD